MQLHESTVSRVTANKYIATPRGIFELKYFFTTAIAGSGGESHQRGGGTSPHTGDGGGPRRRTTFSPMMRSWRRCEKRGVDIARRTVAKYREALRIPSSVQRKREKAAMA